MSILVAAGALGAFAPSAAGAAARFVPGHPQVRVTVAGGCPPSVAADRDVQNPVGAAGRLVPGAPVAGLICRYGPAPLAPPVSGESTSALYRSTRLGRTTARRLAMVIDRLSTKPLSGLFMCPADFGSVTLIAFSYRRRPDVDLWYHDSGCESLDNGRLRAWEPNNQTFYGVFEPLIESLSPATPSTP